MYTVSCPAWYRALRPHTVLACRYHRVLTVSLPCPRRVHTASSEICIAALKYVLPLRNMYCHFEICIATPKYVIQVAFTRSQTITERVDVHYRTRTCRQWAGNGFSVLIPSSYHALTICRRPSAHDLYTDKVLSTLKTLA